MKILYTILLLCGVAIAQTGKMPANYSSVGTCGTSQAVIANASGGGVTCQEFVNVANTQNVGGLKTFTALSTFNAGVTSLSSINATTTSEIIAGPSSNQSSRMRYDSLFLLTTGSQSTSWKWSLKMDGSQNFSLRMDSTDGAGDPSISQEVFNVNAAATQVTFALPIAATRLTSTKTTVSFSATPTFNASLGNSFEITLTGNVTSSTLSNATDGQLLTFMICQDGTGSRTLVWPTNFKGADTIGSTASACSVQQFIYRSSNSSAYAVAAAKTNL